MIVVLVALATGLSLLMGGYWYDWVGASLSAHLAAGTVTLMWTRFWPLPGDSPVSLKNLGDWAMFLGWGAVALLIWTGDCIDRWGRQTLTGQSQPT